MKEETILNVKEYLRKQKNKWDFISDFAEEIDNITDEATILMIADIVKIKHMELLKKSNKNKALEVPVKEKKDKSEVKIYRAKYNQEPLRTKEKQCFKCKEWKPLDAFYTNKTNRDGLQSYCIECQKRVAKNDKQKRKEGNPKQQTKDKISISKQGVFVPTYNATIKSEEIDKVLKAVKKDEPYSGTHNDFICSETGIIKWRVNAVLLYLIQMNRIKKEYESVGKIKYVMV